ncbi:MULTISPECIES: TldD/PmbA family protein [unclassified Okeania]|uniref:TldD/PmbA family protein n=1 Tax=unclassified Okeania TaxID=2634635 RepID=UPI0013B8BD82|nr:MULTISPECIES: TldD/PmbA family protein [unclassified Okeania]NET12428.1 TldD/PmbA family protein [Okeania sp. SIO1H6]NES77129.1 TldD/PmbA family protein [Okeania sp. SIO1H4]NET22867.1 TldD/PmbA family protein [Okeania sp. SIO1H5]NET77275.1 TldD/PmbA family protein [Okeania sp. SIO1F9]NET93888.1 TldD/PmbA family protein [Okeania sp. SIO1H2]
MTQLAEQLLEVAAKAGAEAAEVFQARSHSRPVFFESNRLKQLESTQSEGIALRLWRNGCPGIAVAHGPVEPKALVELALSISSLNQPEYIELSSKAKNRYYPNQGISISVEQLVTWGKEAITLIREVYPDVICHGEWDCEIESTRLVNSLGLDCHHIDTTLSGYVETDWVRGDDLLNISDGQIQRNGLDPRKVANRILQRLDWAQKNVIPPRGRVPILFTAKAADLLWGTFSAALNGKQVLEGASPWSDRLGEVVTNKHITISQEPDEGPFSCPFDDEGTPARSIVFIQNGILQLFYTDRTTGRLLGSGTTGNGFRPDLGSYPTPELFNFIVKPGERSLKESTTMLDDAIIVDQILGGGAGISGDFSINVELGYRVRKGEVVGRVKNTMVAGNVYTALKQLVTLGNDGEWNGSCYTPHVIVEGLSTISRID